MSEAAQSNGPQGNWIGYIDTLLEYYLHIDPSLLTDEEWAQKFTILNDIREREKRTS